MHCSRSEKTFKASVKLRGLLSLAVLCVLLFLTSCNEESKKVKQSKGSDKEIEALIDSTVDFYAQGDYPMYRSAIEEAEQLLTKETDTVLRIRILLNKTEPLKSQGKFDECLTNYFSAANLAKLSQDTSRLGLSYYNISATYYMMQNLEGAKKYNELAQEMYRITKESDRLANCKILNAGLNRKLGKNERAKQGLSEVIEYYTKKGNEGEANLSICFNNYGNILFGEGEYDGAIEFFEQALKISRRQNNKWAIAIRIGNIAEAYLEKGDFFEAKKYIDSSNVIAEEIGASETILANLDRLKNYYTELNQPDKALKVMEDFVTLKTELLEMESLDDISAIEKRYKREFEILEANSKIVVLEKNNAESVHQQKETRMKLYFFVTLSLLIFIVGLIIYRKQQRIRAIDLELHNKEREILASRNELAKSEKLQLENELEFKGKELRTFSVNIAEREKFMDELRSRIAKLEPNEIPNKEVLDELNQLLKHQNEDSAQLYDRIESINESFHFKLSSNYPELTPDDLRLASLLILGLSTKEIASLLSIEPKSVSMKRYRLKMKLDLDSNVDLKQFLMEL